MIHVRWVGIDKTSWDLMGRRESLGGVVMQSARGLTSEISRSTQANSNGRGVTISGHDYPAMEGTLNVVVRNWDRRHVGTWHDLFTRSWSTLSDGEIWVMDSRDYWWSAPARLAREFEEPEVSPWAGGERAVRLSIPVFSRNGIWEGRPQLFTSDGGEVSLHNPGTVTAYPLVKWVGAGQSVTTPGGVTVQLPAVSEPRWLSTDPGMNFVVTDEHGNRDNATWREFRGLTVWGEIGPGDRQTWQATDDVALELVPMSENPWR